MYSKNMISIVAFLFVFIGVGGELIVNEKDIKVLVGGQTYFWLLLTEPLDDEIMVNIHVPEKTVLEVSPNNLTIQPKTTGPFILKVNGISGGRIIVIATLTPNVTSDDKAFIRITVEESEALATASIAVGWIYFAAWSVSFYPQIYENYKRKSVIGLNFDFLSLNLCGYALYGMFNCGLKYIPEIRAEYFARHPSGLNPVQINDIVFIAHAIFATLVTIVQCFFYERGDQRVSTTARCILSLFFLIIVILLGLALLRQIIWLDFIYYCSFIKLTITVLKYLPQAFMNYRRKSTVGWSIDNILLDFTGGMLSMVQMIFNSYNYNDWGSMFGNPTKLGIGILTVFFDIFFMVQHFSLYRHPPKEKELTSMALTSS